MLTNILIVLAVVVILFVIIVALRPSGFRVARSTTVTASPAITFQQVNDLHQYLAWNPFSKSDPAAKNTFTGPPAGIGASLAWAGNRQLGEGRLTVTESCPDELVRYRLEFLKPFKATNTAEFIFKSEGRQTTVEWSMTGKRNFMFKAVGLFMNCDKMIGGMFEQGLANLKAAAEATSAQS